MNTSQQTMPDSGNRIFNSFLVQAWLVLLLASFFGATLAGIQLTLSPKIEANKLNETIEKVPELILGTKNASAMTAQNQKIEIKQQFFETNVNNQKKIYNVFQARMDDQTAGWVVKASGQGYGDKIELLIGLDAPAQTITGLFIIDQKETPGLGNNIVKPVWRNQFINKSTRQHLTAVKTKASAPNEINAITGATISSRSVCNIINQTIDNLKKPLNDAAVAHPKTSDHQQEKK